MKSKYLSWALRILISGLFLLSAIAKIFPSWESIPMFGTSIWPFEKQIVDLGLLNWCKAPYLARAIIGLELTVAFTILFSHWIKKLIIPGTILLLLAFCIHLGIQIAEFGPNNGNCGCFGALIPMTPLEALIKNIITIGLLVFLWFIVTEHPKGRNNLIYPLAIFLACELLMFAAFPFAPCKKKKVNVGEIAPAITNSISSAIGDTNSNPNTSLLMGTQNITKMEDSVKNNVSIAPAKTKDSLKTISKTPQKAALTPTNSKTNTANTPVKVTGPTNTVSKFAPYDNFNGKVFNVDKGQKIVCLFAPGCDHCQATAKEICAMRSSNKDFPEVAIIFMDEEAEKIPDFFKGAGCTFPYQVLDIPSFWTLLGSGTTPGVIGLWNGNPIKSFEGIDKNKFDAVALKSGFNLK
jgi:hypothetical protein